MRGIDKLRQSVGRKPHATMLHLQPHRNATLLQHDSCNVASASRFQTLKDAVQLSLYLMMLIWKSSSSRFFQDPDKKSRHQAKALPLVSESTSSDRPSLKASASESSSQFAPAIALNFISLTSLFPTLFFSAGGPKPSAGAGTVPNLSTLSLRFGSPPVQLLPVAFRCGCIVRLCPKADGAERAGRQVARVDEYNWSDKLFNRQSFP